MSDKSATPAASGAASGVDFTERELVILSKAMLCLKSGPPDIDYEKLAQAVGYTNVRSASNAWNLIRKKLVAAQDADAATTITATPKKKGGAKAKPKVKSEDGEDSAPEVPVTPVKTPRKRTQKKQDVDGDESPKKRGRGPAAKAKQDAQVTVKDEPEDEGMDGSNGESQVTGAEQAGDDEV